MAALPPRHPATGVLHGTRQMTHARPMPPANFHGHNVNTNQVVGIHRADAPSRSQETMLLAAINAAKRAGASAAGSGLDFNASDQPAIG